MDMTQAARPSFFQKLERGRTRGIALFEVIIALGIVGMIIAGAVLLLQGAQERIARNETLQLINQLRAEANRIWASQSTYSGLEIHILAQSGGLPDYVWRDDGSPPNNGVYNDDDSYLSTYEKDIDIWGSATLKRMTIGLADLDPGPCVDILSSWADKTRAVAGIVRASVNSAAGASIAAPATAWWTATGDVSGVHEQYAAPFTAAEVASMCKGTEGNNDLYILFQG